MIDKSDDTFLEQNIKGLMMTLISRWNARMDEVQAGTEFANIRPADMRVFANLRGRTVKLSEIHKEMSFSRQAAQQSVDRLVADEMLAVSADPNSRRDKIVSVTVKGQRWRTIAAGQIRQIAADIGDAIGHGAKETLREYLAAIVSDK